MFLTQKQFIPYTRTSTAKNPTQSFEWDRGMKHLFNGIQCKDGQNTIE